MEGSTDNRVVFNNLSVKFSQLLYGRTEGDRNLINKVLDELIILDYRQAVVTNVTKAVLLVNQCCSLVSPDDSVLVAKCCQLIANLISRQRVQIEGRTLTVLIQWCLHALKQSEDAVTVDILRTIDALLRSNVHHVYTEVIANNSSIVLLAQTESKQEVLLAAMQCLEACTINPDNLKSCENAYRTQLEICTEIFLKYLVDNVNIKFGDFVCYKLVIACINGLRNVVPQNQYFLARELNVLLGIVRSFMVYGIKGVDFVKPQKVMPSPLSVPEPASNPLREKKGGKVTKQRKHRISTSNRKDVKKPESDVDWPKTHYNTYIPATMTLGATTDGTISSTLTANQLKTSDSDFSDSERCVTAKLSIMEGRVRQAAMNLLFNVVKFTDKRTMFSFWSSFIPDGSPSGQHSLATCVLKDPSPKGRMAALNVLLSLLSSSKLYLSQAELSDKSTVLSFTPFSVILGSMVQELHRCLRLALNENSIPVLTQALKCFAALVQATPYHRLSPGIITKVIRNVKMFVDHRDASVQVTALIVLGCILASEPLVPETATALLKHQSLKTPEQSAKTNDLNITDNLDFDYVNFSSDDEEIPQPSPDETEMPWLLHKCLKNLGVTVDKNNPLETLVPAPVKLESLQVISAMTRNYFTTLMAPHLHHVSKALEISLLDKYTDLRLHAGRTLDFIGQAITQHFTNNVDEDTLTIERGLAFWNNLIKRPLTQLIQNEQHPTLRAVGCDCLGSIGPSIFEHLTSEKQILIMMLLLGCSSDEENSVKGAAVRALAICVLYPTLREDPGFVTDTAETVYTLLKDENMTVRIKASWSLGNLSDALVLIRNDASIEEEIPDSLLLKLIEASIKGSTDNDKIKTNTVRALGNLLQLINSELIHQDKFKTSIKQAILALVKNCTNGTNMKVRWNACYAIGNILKNDALYAIRNDWQNSVYTSLTNLVINFRNFKVRINAALALSCPTSRNQYGEFYHLTWNSLMKALENSQNMEDFNEYKHRDHLVEQICLSIGHLSTLLVAEDLNALQDSLVFYSDVMAGHMRRVYERMVPEKTAVLFTAKVHVQSLAAESLAGVQRELVYHLIKVFHYDL